MKINQSNIGYSSLFIINTKIESFFKKINNKNIIIQIILWIKIIHRIDIDKDIQIMKQIRIIIIKWNLWF